MNNKKGFSALIIIFVMIALIAAVTIGTYFILSGQGTETVISRATPTPQSQETSPQQVEVSDSLDLKVIEKELDDTTVSSPESDFDELLDTASQL